MARNNEILFDREVEMGVCVDSAMLRSVRGRVGLRRVVGTTAAVLGLIGSAACNGADLDSRAKQSVLTGLNTTKTEEKSNSVSTSRQNPVSGHNASGREYCAQPETLNDGTDRIRVQVSTSCPEQVITVGGGWIAFDINHADYHLGGGAEVDSVTKEGPNTWIVDPK